MNWKFADSYKNQGQRAQLVTSLRQKGIVDEGILHAIGKIPRHFFLDNAFENFAYQDKPFPIGEGQTISQPFTVARQTELLEAEHEHKILEIGTGSGYQSAVLLELGLNLFSLEFQPKLHKNASFILKKLGYQAVLACKDGSLGWPEHAPFDRILVTAGAPVVPKSLMEQLKIGGKLVIPVGNESSQQMLRITRISELEFVQEHLGNYAFVPLLGAQGWK